MVFSSNSSFSDWHPAFTFSMTYKCPVFRVSSAASRS
jgi:hypothetical protein